MYSSNGNQVPNQFIITDGMTDVFQSYETVIASRCLVTGIVSVCVRALEYSPTTLKYLKIFLGTHASKKELSKMFLENPKYVVVSD